MSSSKTAATNPGKELILSALLLNCGKAFIFALQQGYNNGPIFAENSANETKNPSHDRRDY